MKFTYTFNNIWLSRLLYEISYKSMWRVIFLVTVLVVFCYI
ncbi:hypothetical protein YPPY46_0413 [Yersinia pestis PY-46]|uniref:Uncharacterized protein n=1 Tax=Yersinia pestis biovar Orientalis str. IP275 TaxID=373665 RepID=A0AAV3BEF3_YERPE|nr:hypothetical protein YpAngola_A0673 [Yersinia pestis Angola]EDR34097.1 hypothetical protein YPIP275_3250 [Yersinia pestis biovar Orientalis str. IP275]EDR42963.1 hypothetical protein YpE1979001_0996 [Yersinia pestis biovar Antiqua str. E1979001]EDR49368.1 hypothetical protein YpB42003004_0419 [Yersinia pestis biovar Antiqua str. B42003004]EDR64631.1 hypothetical protein YpK1973002_3427 [Yersinia pestis biovar Mediaevalis str. K1973002]EIQ95163.1 hypothetical protein YPPY02_0388 [Yersinia pe